jgi:hypothetical protein
VLRQEAYPSASFLLETNDQRGPPRTAPEARPDRGSRGPGYITSRGNTVGNLPEICRLQACSMAVGQRDSKKRKSRRRREVDERYGVILIVVFAPLFRIRPSKANSDEWQGWTARSAYVLVVKGWPWNSSTVRWSSTQPRRALGRSQKWEVSFVPFPIWHVGTGTRSQERAPRVPKCEAARTGAKTMDPGISRTGHGGTVGAFKHWLPSTH